MSSTTFASDDLQGRLQNILAREQRIATPESVAKYYLGLRDLKFHRVLYDLVARSQYDQGIIPAPRDHGKSTAVAYVYPVWRILNNPNVRILIAQKRAEQAKKSVRIIRKVFEDNPRVIADFGDMKGHPWEKNSFYIKRTLSGAASKDPTVEGVGVLGAITGGHFDDIILDDFLDEENTKTETKRNHIDNWLRGTILPLAEAGTRVWCICTRKHYRDTYGWLLSNNFWYHPSCRKDVYGHHNSCGYRAIEVEPMYEYTWNKEGNTVTGVKVKGDYEVLEPELPKAVDKGIPVIDWLLLKRGEIGESYFRREYQNDPSGMAGIFFKDEWLGRWVQKHEWHDMFQYEEVEHRVVPPAGELYKIVAIDPAISPGKDTDEFAATTFGVDGHNRIYLLETFNKKMEFPEQVEWLLAQGRTMVPRAMPVDSQAYQLALKQQVQALSMLPIIEVKTQKDKKLRALTISPFLENGRIYVRDDQDVFWNQWRQFPSGDHDDVIDSFMIGIEYLMTINVGAFDWVMRDPSGRVMNRGRP